MVKYIINFAYFLNNSVKYKKVKNFVYNILENSEFKYKKYFDLFMIFLVFSTVGILIYEVKNPPNKFLDDFEFFAIIIFIIEWLGRLWIYSDIHKIIIEDYEKYVFLKGEYKFRITLKKIILNKLSYIFSPMSIIDLLAIIPYYRPLRILRIFLLFRLLKLIRYTNSLNEMLHVLKERKFEFYMLVVMYSIAVVFGSTVIYIYEGDGINENIHNFFDAIYWSIITISTVGYGDISPQTYEGKLITATLIGAGFLVIAFGTSIVTTGLADRMEKIKSNIIERELSKLKNYVIICGYGITGRVISGELKKENIPFVIIEKNCDDVQKAKSRGFLAICGDASNTYLLEEVGIHKGAKAVCAVTNDDAVNLSICLTARTLNSNIKVITRANNLKNKKKFIIAGADEVISEKELSAYISSEYLGQPVAFEAINDIILNNNKDINLEEIEITKDSPFKNKQLKDLHIEDRKLILIGIANKTDLKSFIFNPKEDYILRQGDILVFIGYDLSIKELKALIISKSKFLGV